jgi:E3 ubiquitin-protein ligase RNF13
MNMFRSVAFGALLLSGTNALVAQLTQDNSTLTFNHRTGAFGPQPGSYGIIGVATHPTPLDGCTSLLSQAGDLKNKIVIIERGNCNFTDKVLNAQEAGAIGVVVGNTDYDRTDQLLIMSAPDTFDSSNVKIPAVFVSTNTLKNLNLLMQKGNIRITLDSQGEVSAYSIGGSNGSSSGSSDIIAGLIRMILFLAAGFPSLWMCWLSCFFVGNAFQHCFDKCKRRNRLADIPSVKYNGDLHKDRENPDYIHNTSCVICLDEFMEGQNLKLLPCSHGFCSSCIQSWLADRSDLCPICKRSIFTTPNPAHQNRNGFCCWRQRRVNYVHVDQDDIESAGNGNSVVTPEHVDMNRIHSNERL